MNTPPAQDAPPSAVRETADSAAKLIVEVGPIFVFMIVYNLMNARLPDDRKGEAIFIATGVFIVATVVAVAWAWFKQKRLPPMAILSAVLVMTFGGLTLIFHDAIFIKLKPTIVNGFYAAIIFGSLAVKRNVWKMLFGALFVLPDRIWNILAIRWGVWFIVLALLNEFVWRNYSEAFWANFKFFGVLPLTLIFTLANLPITLKYQGKTE